MQKEKSSHKINIRGAANLTFVNFILTFSVKSRKFLFLRFKVVLFCIFV